MLKTTRILSFIIMLVNVIPAFTQPNTRFRQPHSRNQFEVMIYTSPDVYHNISEPVAILEFQNMAQRHAFGLTWTTINDDFNDDTLGQFDVIVFLNSTSRDLSADQLGSLKTYIRNGGGFVGIHATSACGEEGEWFNKLVGRTFMGHPEEQTAVLKVINKNHPATMHLPDKWVWTDEWYAFSEPHTENLRDLITVDETTYDPARTWGDKSKTFAMGDYHPIAWCQQFEGGRSFYTALGHMPALYKDTWFLDHIYGGIYWAATGLGFYDD